MTKTPPTEEVPAYTRESVMAYLRAAEAERSRLRSAIDEARARAVSARSRIERLDALAVSGEVQSDGSDEGLSTSPLDGFMVTGDCPPRGGTVAIDRRDSSEWPGPEQASGAHPVGDPDALIEQLRSSLAEDTSSWWPVDPGTSEGS